MIELAVLIANAAILTLEVVGGRALTPYFGGSAEVWAGILAVILAGLAIGYHFGGKIADRKKDIPARRRLLAWSLALGGVAIMVSWPFLDAVASAGAGIAAHTSLTVGAAFAALLLLFPGSLLLAASSPIAAKLKILSMEGSASAVGRLSAIAAIGSVLGSLSAGLFLIPAFGSKETLFGGGIVLLFLSIAVIGATRRMSASAIAAGAVSGAIGIQSVFGANLAVSVPGTLIADKETRYNRIWIYDTPKASDGTYYRLVKTDPLGIQCGALMTGSDAAHASDVPIFSYTQSFDAFLERAEDVKDVLVIGGCNYSYPRHIADALPNAHVDVAEIDPGMADIAKTYFGFAPGGRIDSIFEDGRTYLNENVASTSVRYGAIFVDAYNSLLTIPPQLMTKEAFARMQGSLAPGGILVFNLISTFEGPGSSYLASVLATLKAAFPTVAVFKINANAPDTAQNLIVAAGIDATGAARIDAVAKTGMTVDLTRYGITLTRVPDASLPTNGAIVLTDDYAPVEALTEPLRNLQQKNL